MEVIEQFVKPTSKGATRIRPKVITWKSTSMIRNHSFLATVNDICKYAIKKDVVKIGIIGVENSGKSTMAEAVGHGIHIRMQKLFKIPFAVRIFYEDDLLNFKETLKTLTPANYVLVFDDVSFMEGSANKLQISAVKQAITKIRHLEGGKDVKIILINNYHYTKGLDKYLRQSDFKYFTSVGSEEKENMEKMVGNRNMYKINQFIRYQDQCMKKSKWSVRLTPKEFFHYKWQDPFIPALFFDNITLRHIVSPTREFMDRICGICSMAKGVRHSEIPVDQFVQEGETKHGERVFEAAVKLRLFENGMAVYAKSVMNAKKWLDNALSKKLITMDHLMAHYGYSITKTRLTTKFSDLIDQNNSLKARDTTKQKIKKKPLF